MQFTTTGLDSKAQRSSKYFQQYSASALVYISTGILQLNIESCFPQNCVVSFFIEIPHFLPLSNMNTHPPH